MAILRKTELAAVAREDQQEHLMNHQARNTAVPKTDEDCITQVSEEIEGRVTKKLSQEFSRTKSRILGALSNPKVWAQIGTVLATFRNSNTENQEPNEDRTLRFWKVFYVLTNYVSNSCFVLNQLPWLTS